MPVRVLRTTTVGSESSCHAPGFGELDSFKSFLWGCKLDEDHRETEFKFFRPDLEDEEDSDYIVHSLALKQACLLGDVKEVCVVEIETSNFDEEVIKQPIFSLGGHQKNCLLDLHFCQTAPLILRLIEGKGPVYISGLHQTEIPQLDEDDYGKYNDTETDLTEEDSPAKVVKKGTKRKARAAPSKRKQARSEEDEEEDEEDEEEDEEEESMEEGGSVEEETEETEESQEDEEEEEEEEEEVKLPAKGVKSKKGQAKITKVDLVRDRVVLTPMGRRAVANGSAKKSGKRV